VEALLFMAAEDTATATAKRGRIGGGLRRCVTQFFHIAMDVLVLSNGWHCSKIRVYNFTSTTLPLYASCPYRNEGVHGHLLSPAPPDSLASSLQPAPFTSISAPLQPSPSSSPIQFDSVLF
jgi:hypothetical protein